jgi:hypothetical protein
MISPNDALQNAIRYERCLLECVLETPDLVSRINFDLSPHFCLSDHRSVWRAIVKLHSEGIAPDIASIVEESGVDVAVLADLFGVGAVNVNFEAYASRVREAAKERQFRRSLEELGTCSLEDRPRILEQMAETQAPDCQAQRSLFHSYDDFMNAPKLEYAIDRFLQEGGATYIAGLPGHLKTQSMLAMTRSLLSGEPLFGYFKVPKPSKRVLYLVPESTISPFWSRLQLFHLEEYIRSEKLFVRTLSIKDTNGRLELHDPRLLSVAEGSDIFIDTVARFMTRGEDIEDARILADSLFALLGAGARTITAAHHSPKAFETAKYMCLENVVRGSGDLGACISTAWGLRKVDEATSRVYIQNVKARDFEPCEAFILEGRPHLDQRGQFDMPTPPGFAGQMSDHLKHKSGRPETPGKEQKVADIKRLQGEGWSCEQIAEKLAISKGTVSKWARL